LAKVRDLLWCRGAKAVGMIQVVVVAAADCPMKTLSKPGWTIFDEADSICITIFKLLLWCISPDVATRYLPWNLNSESNNCPCFCNTQTPINARTVVELVSIFLLR
jgi:hypothetical protein